jgi:oligopeptidase B
MPADHSRRLPPSAAAVSLPAGDRFAVAPSRPVVLPPPPLAPQIEWADLQHGDRREDEFHWLQNRNHPAVLRYLEAENDYATLAMRHTEALQERLYLELLGRTEEVDRSVPERIGPWLYYHRLEAGLQYPLFCRKPVSDGTPEQVILDLNRFASCAHLRLGASEVSPGHRYLAFALDFSGDEAHTLLVKDLATGRLLGEQIPGTANTLAWADESTLFYVVVDQARRPWAVCRHRLGSDPADDVMVYAERDEAFVVEVSRSRGGDWILLESASGTSTEIRSLAAARPFEDPRMVLRREQDVEYAIAPHGDRLFILTNDSAENFRVVEAPLGNPGREQWREVLAHSEGVKLDAIDAFRDHLVVWEREGGLPWVRVIDLANGTRHRIDFPEQAYAINRGWNPEFDTTTIRFTSTSLVNPPTVLDYDMVARVLSVRKQTEVQGYQRNRYRADRLMAEAPDGAQVPISLVYRWPFPLDGSRPALLLGYGAYGAPFEGGFQSHFLSLLDRGFVVGIAHVRGGDDMGRRWYLDGKLGHKRNTFTDFIVAAEYLIAEGYTSADRLAINGASAGGMMMGAVTNLRPELFRVVIAEVPFLDVVNTMLDPSLPLTAIEYEEWGDPRDPAAYAYMCSYSPYDNIERKAYPHMLVTGGLNDQRVAYWEPAKWTARLRARKTDDNRLLLRTNMGAGHAGASGRYDALQEVAFKYAFILDVLGVS